jgi:hypothetical protein
VTLGQDIVSALPMLRAQAESMMIDSCVIGVLERSTHIDEETGKYTYTLADPVYSGPCRYRAGGTAAGEIDAQGQSLVEQSDVLSLPVIGSEMVQKDMVATVALTLDAAAPFSVRIVDNQQQTFATARRLPVERVS